MEPDYKYKGIAEGIAAFGRNGDTMLMHVNPAEVAALESLAPGSITTNPDTGQPEAFFWLLPAILAALPGAGGAGLTGLAGAMSGAVGGGIPGAIAGAIPAAAGSALTGVSGSLGGLAGVLGAPASVVSGVTPVAGAGGGGAGLGGGISTAGVASGGTGLGGTAAPSLSTAIGEGITAGAEGLGALAAGQVMGPVDTLAGGIKGVTGILTGGGEGAVTAPAAAVPPPGPAIVPPAPIGAAGLPPAGTIVPNAALDVAAEVAQTSVPTIPSAAPNVNLAQMGNIPELPAGVGAPPPGPSLPGAIGNGLGSPDLSGILNQAPTGGLDSGIVQSGKYGDLAIPTSSQINPLQGYQGVDPILPQAAQGSLPQAAQGSLPQAAQGSYQAPTSLYDSAAAKMGSPNMFNTQVGQASQGLADALPKSFMTQAGETTRSILGQVKKVLVGEGPRGGLGPLPPSPGAPLPAAGSPEALAAAEASTPWAQTWQEGGLGGVAGRVGGGLADADPMLLLGGAYMLDKQLQDPGEVPEWAKKRTGKNDVFSDEYEMRILNDPWWGGDFTIPEGMDEAPTPYGPDDPLALMGGYQDEESYWGYP